MHQTKLLLRDILKVMDVRDLGVFRADTAFVLLTGDDGWQCTAIDMAMEERGNNNSTRQRKGWWRGRGLGRFAKRFRN